MWTINVFYPKINDDTKSKLNFICIKIKIRVRSHRLNKSTDVLYKRFFGTCL